MTIRSDMELYHGPKAVLMPDEGTAFTLAAPGVTGLLKLAPGTYPEFKSSAVRYDLAPGASLELYATLLAGRMLYALEGEGSVVLNGEKLPFHDGCFAHLGEGHHATLVNDGADVMQVFVFVFGATPEARPDLMTATDDGGLRLDLDAPLRKVFGLLTLDQAAAVEPAKKGDLIHQLPDTGPSWWQAKPTAGWVEVKLAPFTSNVHHYGVLMQTLLPDSRVREHAHNQLNEFFVISKGTARAALDGAEALCPKGSVIVIGRNVFHWWANGGDGDAQNVAIIDPPGVEGALAFTGRPRPAGAPAADWPSDIPRNAETGRILTESFGFVIRGDAADSQG